MLLLTQGHTADSVIVTLEESRTITSPYYHFLFVHVATNAQVIVSKQYSEDESSYPQRYNQFAFNTSTLFANQPTGQWNYEVFESAGEDYTEGLNRLEIGKMLLQPAEETTTSGSSTTTTYAGYGG